MKTEDYNKLLAELFSLSYNFKYDYSIKYKIQKDLRTIVDDNWSPTEWLIKKAIIKSQSKRRRIPEYQAIGIMCRTILWALLEYFHKNPKASFILKTDLKEIVKQLEFRYKSLLLPVINARVTQQKLIDLAASKSVQTMDFLRSSQLVEEELQELETNRKQRRINILGQSHLGYFDHAIDILADAFIELNYLPSKKITVLESISNPKRRRLLSTRNYEIVPKQDLYLLMHEVIKKKVLF